MLNVGVPELDGPEASAAPAEQNPEERNPEIGLETGENANLDDTSDPYLEKIASIAPEATPPEKKASVSAETTTEASAPEVDSSASFPVDENPPSTPNADHDSPLNAPLGSSHQAPHDERREAPESFGELLYEFEKTHKRAPEDGSRQIDATVVSVNADSVFLDIGFKIEGVLPLSLFASAKEQPKAGDKLLVTPKGRNEEGYYELSLPKIAQPKDWSSLEEAFAAKSVVAGTVTSAIKGGLTVDVGVRAFMPASRSGVRDAADLEKLVGQEIRCRIIKLDVADEDVVVDRRIVLEEEERSTKERRYAEITEGIILAGTVRSLTDYGAFVDLGGIDALLHISDMAWTRVATPSDVVTVGQQIEAKVLKVELDKRRISIGLKQLMAHPWDAVTGKFTVGERVTGVVTRLTDFGAFVELAPGIEGLIHVSEMSWAKKVRKPGDMVKVGDTVEVVVLSINAEERRISLGLKQALGDPWAAMADKLSVGATVEGPVVSFTKFGAFVQVAEGVEGMVHISEIVADKRINHPQDELKIGQVVKAQVLEVDREKRQLKLSIKQLIPSSLDEYLAEHHVGDTVSGRVIEATGDRLLAELGEGIRVSCQVLKAAPAAAAVKAEPSTDVRPDLSALSSMLKARWKNGPAVDAPQSKKSESIRAGQMLSFRITALDAAAKKIEIEAV
ncbi:MAG TPA: 30S ribosomal protein S1 [Acidisarcina sp.]